MVSRERALRGAGIDLVAAASHEQVCKAAIAGVRRLLGDDQSVRLSVLANGGAEVVASSEEAGWQLDESTEEWLSRTHAFSLRAISTQQIRPRNRRTAAGLPRKMRPLQRRSLPAIEQQCAREWRAGRWVDEAAEI